MTELEILKQRFSDMAKQFPGLMHILITWPKDEEEPKLNPRYMPTEDNLLVTWGDSLVRKYLHSKNMEHWLIKPIHASWNKDHARENFQNLAQNAGRVLCVKGFLAHLNLPEYILKLSEYKLSNNQKERLWVLVVHELGNQKRFTSDWRDGKAILRHVVGLDTSVPKQNHGYYEIQKDFFYDSSLVISKLVEMKKEKHLQTGHSPDFRSVNWFGW